MGFKNVVGRWEDFFFVVFFLECLEWEVQVINA